MTTATGPTIQTLTHTPGSGWNAELPASLDSPRTLVVAFCAPGVGDDPTPIRELRDAFPTSHLIGCSTAGEIAGTMLLDESVSVGVIRFERTELSTVHVPVPDREESEQAGAAIIEQLGRPGLRGIMVLSDGLNVNGTTLIRGLLRNLPEGVVITGGLAGDGADFGRTWVIREGEPASGCATAVGFYGDSVRIGHGSKGGWDVFGPERLVTRADGPVLYELDGKPILPLYRNYLGEFAEDLPASALRFPLAFRRDRDDEDIFVRSILAIDEAEQSMTFGGDIPEGYLAQLMRANFDRVIDGAGQSALATRGTSGTDAACLSIVVSCVGRRLVLGERTEEELERAAEYLPAGSSQVGFYSYGEISPNTSGRCELHNQTMTLTTITEL